jgi:hypothetical protein
VEAPTHEISVLFPSPVQLVIVVNNLRPDGAIRGISGALRREDRESVMAIPRFSMW